MVKNPETDFFWILAGLATVASILYFNVAEHDVGPVGLAMETRALFDVLVMGAYLGFMVAVGLGLAYQKLTSPEGQ
jgi:hypothetical protein